MADEEAFTNQQEFRDFLDLVMRHWNAVSDVLHSGDVFLPLLLEDEQGIARANDWAQGFMRGMALRHDDWRELLDDEEHGGALIPIFALAHEHHADPRMSSTFRISRGVAESFGDSSEEAGGNFDGFRVMPGHP